MPAYQANHYHSSNLKYVVNHDMTYHSKDNLAPLHSGRALGLSEPWDIIQLHPTLSAQWSDIHRHYQKIGLSHSDNVIWNLDLKQLGSHIGYQPSVSFFGVHECHYWGDHAWFSTVEFINSKNNFISLAQELHVPTPITYCFDDKKAISDESVDGFPYPCYLKASQSVPATNSFRCENPAQLRDALEQIAEDFPIQIQQVVEAALILNLKYKVVGNNLYRLTVSEQFTDHYLNKGNRAPIRHQPWESVAPIANWLKERGMKGVFTIKVAAVNRDHGFDYSAIKCTPGHHDAFYPALIANKLNISSWSAISCSTRYKSLSPIDLGELEYNPLTQEGVILVNWGSVLDGKLVILLAGSSRFQQALAMDLKQIL